MNKMKTYLTEYYVSNEIGRVHKMCGDIQAHTKEEAIEICKKIGHAFVGELIMEIDAPEMAGLCDAIQEQRDKEWLDSIKKVEDENNEL